MTDADQIEDVEVEEIEPEQVDEVETQIDDEDEAPIEPEQETEDTEAEQDQDEIVVSIGDESPTSEENGSAPEWVRELRKQHREQQRENRKLKKQLEEIQQGSKQRQQIQLGRKPTLEDADYDAELYERQLVDWYEKKRQLDEQQAQAQAEAQQQQAEWQQKLQNYAESRATLKVRDFEDAEMVVQDNFTEIQQGVILQGAENSALVVYALGKNPKKAKEIASIKDPVKFAFAVAKLEKDLKVSNRKAAVAPERTISGRGRISGAVDSTLERLRAEAEKTGDYTKVMQYRRQKRAASK